MSLSTFSNNIKNITSEQFINYLIIGYAFSLATSKAGIVFFEHMIILSFLYSLIKGNIKNVIPELKKSKIIIMLFLFLSLSLIAVLWSSDKIVALLYIKKYIHFLIIPIIYLYFNKKYIHYVLTAFLLGMLLSVIMSYGIFFEIIHYKDVLPSDPSPFMNRSDYSLFLAFTAMLLLNKLLSTNNTKYKLFYFMFFFITISSLFLNGGRTGQFIFVVTLIITFVLNFKNKILAGLIATLLAVGIVSIAYNVSPVFKIRGQSAYTDITETIVNKNYEGSFGQRVSLWIMGTNVFSDNFLLGTGIGDEKTGMQKYANKYKISLYQNLPDEGHIDYHSMYIQHAVQLGIFGLILMFYLIYCLFAVKFKSALYRNINIAFATSIFIYSTVGNVLHTIVPMAFFAFFAAILIAISRIEYKS